MTDIQAESQRICEALKRAVAEALEKKRRLGQYAVLIENGKPVRVEADHLPRKDAKPPNQ